MKQLSRDLSELPAVAFDSEPQRTNIVFEDVVNPLTAFAEEPGDAPARQARHAGEFHPQEQVPADAGQSAGQSRSRPWLAYALAVVVLAQAPFVVLWVIQAQARPAGNTGTLYVETDPPGAEVLLEHRPVGTTPIRLSLTKGRHVLELHDGGREREIDVAIEAGETVRHRIELATAPAQQSATVSAHGSLRVTTQPPGAVVTVDGTPAGPSPVTLSQAAVGTHTVSVRFDGGNVEQRVVVEPGATASLVVAMPRPPGTGSGWVTFVTPVLLQIFEQGRLIGTTNIDRLMLPAGRHTLELVNTELGFRQQRSVTVDPSGATTLRVELPRASLSINAQPWANVWVDGESVGETPIGNLSRPIGRHDVVLRHPSLGERKLSVLVTLKEPARVGVDFRRTSNQIE
jgi:hypothetical protein